MCIMCAMCVVWCVCLVCHACDVLCADVGIVFACDVSSVFWFAVFPVSYVMCLVCDVRSESDVWNACGLWNVCCVICNVMHEWSVICES